MAHWQSALFGTVITAVGIAASAPFSMAQNAAANFQVVETTIDDIHTAMRAGRLTAHQLTQLYLDRIRAYDKDGPKINAVITLNANALADADRLDAAYRASGFAGPLPGTPVLVAGEIGP